MYIAANFDKWEYIRAEAFGEDPTPEGFEQSYQGVMMALVVLLADGNGRGGGDLNSEHPIIGSWAGNRVAIIDDEVKDSKLSLAGQSRKPLQKQMLTHGKDVSQQVFEAIREGEGKYWRLHHVRQECLLPLALQVKLSPRGVYWASARARLEEPLDGIDDFCALIGAKYALSPETLNKNVESALNAFVKTFFGHQKITWSGVSISTLNGFYRKNEDGLLKKGIKEMVLEGVMGTEAGSPNPTTVAIVFGKDGTPAKEVYQKVFGIFLDA